MWSADIVNFFPRVQLKKLMHAIASIVPLYIQDEQVVQFLTVAVEILLDKKFRTLEDFQKEQRLRDARSGAG